MNIRANSTKVRIAEYGSKIAELDRKVGHDTVEQPLLHSES